MNGEVLGEGYKLSVTQDAQVLEITVQHDDLGEQHFTFVFAKRVDLKCSHHTHTHTHTHTLM